MEYFPAPASMQNQMMSNLCVKHFPEPIIYISDEPMCKDCIPEFLERSNKKKEKSKDTSNEENQVDKLQQLFGTPTENLYQTEKSLINNCVIRLEDFRGDFRYIQDDIDDRVTESQ